MKLSLSRHILPRLDHRPEGYLRDIFANTSVIYGDYIEIPDAKYKQLVEKYQSGPTLTDLLANFTGAMARWASSGFPLVTKETFDARFATCSACEHWAGKTCRKCGCTKLKLWLATERCPLDKWSHT